MDRLLLLYETPALAWLATTMLAAIATALVAALAQFRWEAAKRADAMTLAHPTLPLAAGVRVVAGTAEWLGGAPPVEVRVVERGKDNHWSRDGWFVHWTEERREVKAEPFVLVTDRGERVTVTPPKTPRLEAILRPTARPAHDQRERTASLGQKERAVVVGRLTPPSDGMYRSDGEQEWQLDALDGWMSISTLPPGEAHVRWQVFYRRIAVELLGLLVLAGAISLRTPVVSVAVACVYAAMFFRRRARTRVWYEQARVMSVEPGRLPAPPPPAEPEELDAPPGQEVRRVVAELKTMWARMEAVDRSLDKRHLAGVFDPTGDVDKAIVRYDRGEYRLEYRGERGRTLGHQLFKSAKSIVEHVIDEAARKGARDFAAARHGQGAKRDALAREHHAALMEAAFPGWAARPRSPSNDQP